MSLLHNDPFSRRLSPKPSAFAVEFYIESNFVSGTIPSIFGELEKLGTFSFVEIIFSCAMLLNRYSFRV
jgi:hypothetical protein